MPDGEVDVTEEYDNCKPVFCPVWWAAPDQTARRGCTWMGRARPAFDTLQPCRVVQEI